MLALECPMVWRPPCRELTPHLPCSCSDTDAELSRKVEDLEDVRFLVNVLNEASAGPVPTPQASVLDL